MHFDICIHQDIVIVSQIHPLTRKLFAHAPSFSDHCCVVCLSTILYIWNPMAHIVYFLSHFLYFTSFFLGSLNVNHVYESFPSFFPLCFFIDLRQRRRQCEKNQSVPSFTSPELGSNPHAVFGGLEDSNQLSWASNAIADFLLQRNILLLG